MMRRGARDLVGHARRDRGFVLIAVLVVIAAAILVATGAIFAARGATASSRAADLERRLRDAALDGVRVAADRLARDRAALLAGGVPKDNDGGDEGAVLLSIPDGPRQIEVRLIPQWSGALYASECAKLDANTAPSAAIERLADSGSETARAICTEILARRPLASIDVAASFAGTVVDADADAADSAVETVLGPLAFVGEERTLREEQRGGARDAQIPLPLIELLTVHSAEPLVDLAGNPRLDLIAAFDGNSSGGRATASLELLEDAEVEVLEKLVLGLRGKQPPAAGADGAIAAALLGRGVEPARVDRIMDQCTLEAGTHGAPRVDIVRADVRVLSAIEGLGPEAAARIIDLRGTLDEDERAGTSWLLTRRVLGAEEYGAVAGRISHRSAIWRCRVEARIAAAEDAGDNRVVEVGPRTAATFDCIIDISAERPRLAFLRDVTLLSSARALAARSVAELDGAESDLADAATSTDGEGPTGERISGLEIPDLDAERASDIDAGRTSDIDDAPTNQPFGGARPRPSRTFRSPRFDLPAPGATMSAPPERGRARPSGRDIPRRGTDGGL
jgi:type II secretory pathway pseudopilin PulG